MTKNLQDYLPVVGLVKRSVGTWSTVKATEQDWGEIWTIKKIKSIASGWLRCCLFNKMYDILLDNQGESRHIVSTRPIRKLPTHFEYFQICFRGFDEKLVTNHRRPHYICTLSWGFSVSNEIPFRDIV